MSILEKNILTTEDKRAILSLWNSEYPESLSYANLSAFEDYLQKLEDPLHLMVWQDDDLMAWAFHFLRENERWFAVIVSTSHQKKGLGKLLLTTLKSKSQSLNGWVIDKEGMEKSNGETYLLPLQFYMKNGFKLMPEIRLETEKLSAVKIVWSTELK